MNWSFILAIQVFVWLIVLFEWKQLINCTKTEKITFASLLTLSVILSFLKLDSLPGPTTLINYIFGPE